MKKILPLISILILSSCSVSLQDQYCNIEGASQSARLDATGWKAYNPMEHGVHCKEEDKFNDAAYNNIYTETYDRLMTEQCSESGLTQYASRNVNSNDYTLQNQISLEKCQRVGKKVDEVKKYYKATFQKLYCTNDNFTRLAKQDTNSLKNKNFDYLNVCSKKKTFKSVYSKSWDSAIKDVCGPVNLNSLAKKDARGSLPMNSRMNQLSICPENLKNNAQSSYMLSYQQEQNMMAQEEQLKELRQQLVAQQYELSQRDYTAYGNRFQTKCRLTESGAEIDFYGNRIENGPSHASFKVDFFNAEKTTIDSVSSTVNLAGYTPIKETVYSTYAQDSDSCSVRYLNVSTL
jgi:hypothetical protein